MSEKEKKERIQTGVLARLIQVLSRKKPKKDDPIDFTGLHNDFFGRIDNGKMYAKYKKIISSEISLENYSIYKTAIAYAYNKHDFKEAQKGIYKLLGADFSVVENYYVALKKCFYAIDKTHFNDPMHQIFAQINSINYLKVAIAMNFIIMGFQLSPISTSNIVFYFLVPLNVIAIFFIGTRTRYNRLIMCTNCLQFSPEDIDRHKRFCLRCGEYLESNLWGESLSNMEPIEKDKLIIEMNEFINLVRKHRSFHKAISVIVTGFP